MDRIDGQPVYSATDLVAYLACEHLTQLERAALAGPGQAPDAGRSRARRHPQARLPARGALPGRPARGGRTPVTIELDGSAADRGEELRAAAARTIEAMAAGADVIYQATFFDGTFRGHADFLLRVEAPERPSRWGPYHYEVADTKLARHVKASAVLQICSYVDQLEAIQGVRPGMAARRPRRQRPAVERLPRRRLHGLLPERPRSIPAGDGRRDAADLPADRDLSRAGRALRRLPLGGRVRRPPARGRPPEPGRRDLGAPATAR